MALNQVQQDFVNNAGRVMLERMIQAVYVFDAYVADYDALQAGSDSIPTDSTILDDAGAAPRDDAPILLGSDLQALRNISELMSQQLSTVTKQTLIGKMKRTLNSVLRIGT